MSIPNIIHQLWIGPKPRPSKFMDTWKNMNPDFEYIWWSENELEKRNITLECTDAIEAMEEINGKADIIRWELLYRYGGVFIDADSICVNPLDKHIMSKKAFAGYENEKVRPDLVATGTMGFPPNHPLCRAAIDYILNNKTDNKSTGKRAWATVGPMLLTRLYQTGKYMDLHIFPSYYFLPIHYTNTTYTAHSMVYAYQEWGSTKQNYDVMNNIELPLVLLEPKVWVSILIPSYNTKFAYINDCIESIKNQEGHFGMEIVWVNDNSNELNTTLLEKILKQFEETSRFIKVKYIRMYCNMGVGYCLHEGLLQCSHEIVFRMDSDDIMLPNRISAQLDFMNRNKKCMLLGSNITFFKKEGNKIIPGNHTKHPTELTFDMYKKTKPTWFMNHPTFCFRKSAVLEVGNYNKERIPYEDFELELKILKKYKKIHNIKDVLLLYRLHPDQVTYQGKCNTPEMINKKNSFIDSIINE